MILSWITAPGLRPDAALEPQTFAKANRVRFSHSRALLINWKQECTNRVRTGAQLKRRPHDAEWQSSEAQQRPQHISTNASLSKHLGFLAHVVIAFNQQRVHIQRQRPKFRHGIAERSEGQQLRLGVRGRAES